jgi:hypothetical protein
MLWTSCLDVLVAGHHVDVGLVLRQDATQQIVVPASKVLSEVSYDVVAHAIADVMYEPPEL